MPVIGRTLGGRYIVETRVGGGGMATVYRGMDTYLRRQVALKVLRNQFVGDAEFVARFRREARAAASLSHPNIVAVYDVGQEGEDCYFIVQEFVDGRTLKDRIVEEGPLPPPEALRITQQVLRALGHAHAAGVIHRDVKPQNVLLTRDGRVKVTDFGIARAEAGVTMAYSGAIVGTAHYAAPEQVRGQLTDERCDIYSTGVMLFEMLVGQPPFDGEGPLAVALQHIEQPVPDVHRSRPDLPPGVCALVRRAMGKQPDQRYRTTAEFEEDIADVLSGRAPAHAIQELPAPVAPEVVVAGALAAEAAEDPVSPPAARAASRWRRTAIWGASAIILVGMLAGGGAWAAKRYLYVPTVSVPNVTGKDITSAGNALLGAGLQYLPHTESNATVPANEVVSTDPAAGTLLRKGGRVDVWMSSGPPPVQLPDVSDLSRDAAQTELTGMGLQVKVQSSPEFSPTVPAGSVISSLPPAGAQVQAGSTVTLTLSAGSQDSGGVPDYIGKMADKVEPDVAEHQWQYTVQQRKSGWPLGIVVATDPAAGTPLLPGDRVALTVSSGCLYSLTKTFQATPAAAGPAALPPNGAAPGSPSGFSTTAAGPPPPPQSSAASSTTASAPGYSEQVVLQDGTDPARTIFDQVVPPGQTFQVPFCWASPQGATYTWMENGVPRQTQTLNSPAASAADTTQAG